MDQIERRAFMKGAGFGALAFTVGGVEVLLTPGQARAQGRAVAAAQRRARARPSRRSGETLVPGAREAGIAHFVDQQISVPAEEALLQARIFNVRPPFANFYRAALGAIDRGAAQKVAGRICSSSTPKSASLRRQHAPEQDRGLDRGRPAASSTPCCALDAVDVVYGTMEGYAALGIPYMAHIAPTKRW